MVSGGLFFRCAIVSALKVLVSPRSVGANATHHPFVFSLQQSLPTSVNKHEVCRIWGCSPSAYAAPGTVLSTHSTHLNSSHDIPVNAPQLLAGAP